MDSIRFKIVHTEFEFGDAIEILVNGMPLLELVQATELPFAKAEGHPEMAGAYTGLPAAPHLPPSRHFWGESGRSDGLTEIYGCGDCGEIGCWPLQVRIRLTDDRVIWSDFQQPHRREGDRRWRYDYLGPFVFPWIGYDGALVIAASSLRGPTSPDEA